MSVRGIGVQLECRIGYLLECLLDSHLPCLAASHFQEWCDGEQRAEGGCPSYMSDHAQQTNDYYTRLRNATTIVYRNNDTSLRRFQMCCLRKETLTKRFVRNDDSEAISPKPGMKDKEKGRP